MTALGTRWSTARAAGRAVARTALLSLLGLAFVVQCSSVAAAHEVQVQRFTTPIPLPVLFAGAGAVVALTAAISARVVGEPTVVASGRSVARLPASVATPLRAVLRAAALVAVPVLLWAGLFGRQVQAENLATVVVWPLWFDGLALLAALVGSPWLVCSPWRTIDAALRRLEGGSVAAASYPPWLGVWPAVVSFALLVGVLENLTVVPLSPRATAFVVAVYGLAMVGGGLLFGRAWFANADFVEVFLRLFARVSPVRFDEADDGGADLTLRAPWRGCARAVGGLGGVAFVIATVFTISFDGFADTRSFQTLTIAIGDRAGVTPGLGGILLYVVGLVAFVVAFVLVVRLVATAGGTDDRRPLLLAFAPTVLPIAVGYGFAHYGTYVVQNAAVALHLTMALFVAAPPELQPLSGLTLPVYWGFQVVAIVLGHVVAVVAAHYVSLDAFGEPRRAWRAHLPLVALMVGYTVLSLWIISQPVVA